VIGLGSLILDILFRRFKNFFSMNLNLCMGIALAFAVPGSG
jgi:hypothetical protein